MNLLEAAEHLDIKKKKKLLDKGVDVNESGYYGQTALHIAIDSAFEEAIYIFDTKQRIVEPKLDFIELLILNGANHNKPDNNGRSPMDWAIERKNEAFIEKFKTLIM